MADSSSSDFILADAKDADMAAGIAAPGPRSTSNGFRSLQEYRDLIRQNISQGLVDIMLTSCSTLDSLMEYGDPFEDSTVTPAFRANDATDIWMQAGANYMDAPSRPFRTAVLAEATQRHLQENSEPPSAPKVNLALYSVTFNNDVDRDLATLNAYRDFRIEASDIGCRHFLEVFNPNKLQTPVEDVNRYVNDSIARLLAGISHNSRPLFLKVAYNGPAAMEQLASYDSQLIIGILGGSSGTTFDAFRQLWEARKYGARAALYGRMINHSEHQGAFIQHLRWLADGALTDASEAVRSYHHTLGELGVAARRTLEDDLQPTLRTLDYSK